MTNVTIPFGPWLPSSPKFNNPGCVVADNCIPSTSSYKPLRSLSITEDEISATVLGAEQVYTNSGVSVIVGGYDDGLFVRNAGVTETTGLSSIGDMQAWDFCKFNDFVIATALNNNPQYLTDIDSDDTFSDLAGSPPQARFCDRVGDFVMLGNIADAPYRIQWSSLNSPATSWAPDRLTQAGFADLDTGYGSVQRVVGGRYALVFQERGVHRLSYVGPPAVWRADPVSRDRGTIAPFSVVTVGFQTFFLAQDGFFVTNGSEFQSIGSQRVNRWFFDNVDQSEISTVHAAVDWQNECVFWAFKSGLGAGFDRFIIYSWAQQQWSSGTASVDWIVGSALDGIDLDSLDAVYGDLDQIPVSLDSSLFKGGNRTLSAFDTDHFYGTFTGSPLQAEWETAEMQPGSRQRVFVSEITPIMEADEWDAEASIFFRDNTGGEYQTAFVPTGWGGFVPVRAEGVRLRVALRKPAGSEWSDMQGVQCAFAGAGER
jgi:hypothetical protein